MADARLIHVDPLSGLQTYTAVEDGKDIFAYHLPNQRAHVEMAQGLKDDEAYTREGIKNSALHYAHIDDMTLMKMFTEDKINPFAPEYKQAVVNLLNTKYQYCLTTKLRHVVKG